jgi:DNA-binding response OmpR family regulator
MKILIADDDDATRLVLASALTKLGHDVHEATNGREAWEAWLDDNQAENVEQIITSGHHLLQLIYRILAVSKSRADELNFFAFAGERLPRPQSERLAR